MSAEENKAIDRRFLEEVWSKGNLAALDEILAPVYINHGPANPEVRGFDGFK